MQSSKYSKEFNSQIRTSIFSVLAESGRSMTRDDIRVSLPSLSSVTPQKISSILTQMYNEGFIHKAKGTNGKMMYWIHKEDK